jgi:carbon monoxide dehydrogenase subunit G
LLLEQSFEVARPIVVVWQAFQDLRATASCIPGAEITEVEDDRRAAGTFRIQLGPIKAAFAGEAEIARDDITHSGTITGSGRDGKSASRVKSSVEYKLVAVGESATRIDLKVDYNIAGPLAQFSRGGIVKDIAASITKMFAANLEAMLVAMPAPAPAPAATEDRSTADCADAVSSSVPSTPVQPMQPRPASAPQSLNLVSLLWSLLRQRIAGLFRSSGS